MINIPHVSIIILNWNNPGDTLKCLRNLENIEYENISIVLVDNGSTDESQKLIHEYLKKRFNSCDTKISPGDDSRLEISCGKKLFVYGNEENKQNTRNETNVHFINNEINLGFSGGCNQGIVYAVNEVHPDYILLLNNDVRVTKNFLNHLVQALQDDPNSGIVGPKILAQKDGPFDIIDFAGGAIDLRRGLSHHIGGGKPDDGSHNDSAFVDYIEGSCMLIKMQTIDEVGLFDDQFFAYWEETDFCVRARKLGHKSLYCPSSIVTHKGSSSTPSRVQEYLMARNRILFEKKHATKKQIIIFFLYLFLWDLYKRTAIITFYYRDFDRLRAYLFGVNDALRSDRNAHFNRIFG